MYSAADLGGAAFEINLLILRNPYYFRATSMALLCLVRLKAYCYCADRAGVGSSPEDQRS
jgi:hypothetical protein